MTGSLTVFEHLIPKALYASPIFLVGPELIAARRTLRCAARAGSPASTQPQVRSCARPVCPASPWSQRWPCVCADHQAARAQERTWRERVAERHGVLLARYGRRASWILRRPLPLALLDVAKIVVRVFLGSSMLHSALTPKMLARLQGHLDSLPKFVSTHVFFTHEL